MNKKFSKVMALTIALVMCLVMSLPAMALKNADTTAPIVKIPVNLIVTNEATTINETATLTFNVEAAELTDATGFKISKGILEGLKISNNGADYTTGAPLTTTLTISDTEVDAAIGNSGTYTDEIYLDFSDVNFVEPGVYRYSISQDCDNEEVVLDAISTRYIDVYVGYGENSDTLEIQGTILHSQNEEIVTNDGGGTAGINPAGKNDGFTNTLDNYTLTITNTVSGNQASRTDDFKYVVEITLPEQYTEDAQTFNVRVLNADDDDSYPSSITVAAGSVTVSQEFSLHHNQSIVIEGLPAGATYVIKEVYGDYAPSYTSTDEDATTGVKEQADKTYTVTKSGDGIASNTVVRINNDRTGTIPTGVILTVAPFAALMLLGAAGIIVISRKKSKAM